MRLPVQNSGRMLMGTQSGARLISVVLPLYIRSFVLYFLAFALGNDLRLGNRLAKGSLLFVYRYRANKDRRVL